MCFRETLIVGHLGAELKNAPPDAVGGLCLNIQKAKGSHPLDRKIPTFDEEPPEPTDDVTSAEVREIKEVAARAFSGLLFQYTKTNMYTHTRITKIG